MRMILKQLDHGAVLEGVGKPITLETLVQILQNEGGELEDPGSPSFDRRLVENGGEAWIRLHEGTALRFERKLLEPSISEKERERFLRKLKALQELLPPEGAVVPQLPLFVEGDRKVVGHTMEYVQDLLLFKDMAARWTAKEATQALLELHRFMTRCHGRGIKIGEVNPRNFGLGVDGFVAIDTLAYDIPDFPCETGYPSTIDPVLLYQDETIDEHDKRAWERQSPYSVNSDWYGFSCIVLEVLIGVGPWAGAHRLVKDSPELRQQRVRILRGLSIFDSNITLNRSSVKRTPEALSEPLYNYLYEVFNKQHRGVFPESLLSEMRWTRCPACQNESAACSCPC